ncbi:MAG: hypothetical protein R3F50_21065 [Gammaproteobacteria bacterium]|jgi:hypothetical protein
MKRKIHQVIDVTLFGVGIVTILASVVLVDAAGLQAQVMLVILGLLVMEAGVWGAARKAFSNERQYSRLREEGDRMIDLIRKLNGAAVARAQGVEDGTRFQATLEEMHASVRFMAELAAVKDDQNYDRFVEAQSGSSQGESSSRQHFSDVA